MNPTPAQTLLLLAAASALLVPVATASNPENDGYTCAFGYNAGADANVCYRPTPASPPTVTVTSTTVQPPCVIGNFPCSLGPASVPFVSVSGLRCIYRVDVTDLHAFVTTPCVGSADVYLCSKHGEVYPLVDQCLP